MFIKSTVSIICKVNNLENGTDVKFKVSNSWTYLNKHNNIMYNLNFESYKYAIIYASVLQLLQDFCELNLKKIQVLII